MDSMKKNIALLATCQALMMTCNSLVIATSALVGLALASNKWPATLPLGLQFLAVMSLTLPASLFMKRFLSLLANIWLRGRRLQGAVS
jgi:hypothetical protein